MRDVRDLVERDAPTRCAAHCDRAGDELEIFGRGFHHVRGNLDGLGAHFGAGEPARVAGDHRRAAAAGPAPERGRVGVALHDDDVVDVDAELLRNDLGHRRLDALPVRAGAERNGDRTARVDSHDRGLGTHRVHHPGARFDIEPDADTEQPPLFRERTLLLVPERVVVDDLGGLFERVGRARELECDAGRHRVRQFIRRDHVPPAPFERVDAELTRRLVDHLLASNRLEHPRARDRRRGRRCWSTPIACDTTPWQPCTDR